VAVVELANGHRLVGHLPRRLRVAAPPLAAGMRVRMRLSPCDLSHGRISEILTG
jgi:translation initiation factor IF-1